MSFTFNTSNNIGKVRAMVGDVTESTSVLSDEQITVFLDIQSNDLFKSAAMALRAMSANKAILAKYRRAGNYTEDTRNIAKGLLDLAKDYEEQSNLVPADAQAEIIYTDFNFNEILINKIVRGELPD